jgi:hypothetical protein
MHALGPRPLVAALVPALIVIAVFHWWLRLDLVVASAAGVAWAFGSLVVTRLLYDDAAEELAAFQAADPALAGTAALRLDAARDASTATPLDEPS